MSRRGHKAWTIRLNPEQTITTNNALELIQTEENLSNRALAFTFIMENTLLGFNRDETPASVTYTLAQVNCAYLCFEPPNYVCNETVASKKRGSPLGSVSEYVIRRCRDCRRWKEEKAQEDQDKESLKIGMRKIMNFRKLFLKIARDGFEADVHICNQRMLEHGQFTMSRDGVNLPCPLSDNETVSIRDVCNNAINPNTSSPPCEFLVTVAHKVRLSQTQEYGFMKDIVALEPPGREKDRVSVEAEFKVANDERK